MFCLKLSFSRQCSCIDLLGNHSIAKMCAFVVSVSIFKVFHFTANLAVIEACSVQGNMNDNVSGSR